MPRVNHFDVAVSDPERAMKFYRDVLGWSFVKWQGPLDYWMISTGGDEPGIDGGLSVKDETTPDVYLTVEVPSIDEYVAKVEPSGGKVIRPKMAIPGVGWFALIHDTEGIVLGLIEMDETAI